MKEIDLQMLQSWYEENYQDKIEGRRVTLSDILPLLNSLNGNFGVKKIGESFLKQDIFSVQIGSGKMKVLIWTQMHGNESTGTKALFDLFNFFQNPGLLDSIQENILNNLTITCIPLLNPDGAQVYTRVNAENIDLNRDVVAKEAKESTILQEILKQVNPQYCFNMHDQRTIFSVGEANNPATISFLAPSEDPERNITKGRKQTMHVVNAMYRLLKQIIPNQIGRYTDEFYPTATGDNFQKMGYNTVLIESGHFKDDYERETTREFTFYALFQGLFYIANKPKADNHLPYFEIPDNEKFYLDILLKNVVFKGSITDIGLQFEEKFVDNKIVFLPKIEKIDDLSEYNANHILDGKKLEFKHKKEIVNWVNNAIY